MERFWQKCNGFFKGCIQVLLTLIHFRDVLRKKEIVLFEIGGRGGPSFGYRTLKSLNLLEIHGFEPDPEEAKLLREKNAFNHVYPFALGGEVGTQVLYLTFHPGCSSLLRPLPESFASSSIFRWLQVEKELTVNVSTLNEVSGVKEWCPPSFLTIDVQGAERELLREGRRVLSSVLGLKVECRIRPMYQGEALLPELVALLEKEGFLFRDAKVVGSFDREAVEFDCLFVRRDKELDDSQKQLVRWWEMMNSARPENRATVQ